MKSWKISRYISILFISAYALAQDTPMPTANVQKVGFKFQSGKSQLEIVLDHDVVMEKTVSEADKQVIIDIKNAKISKKWSRRIDTSQHKSNVALISPYQNGDGSVRIVMQLKDLGDVEVSQSGTKIVAVIDNKTGASSSSAVAKTNDSDTIVAPSADAPAEPMAEAAPEAEPTAIEPTAGDETLDAFDQAQKSKTYVGKKITLQVRDAELADIFRAISEASEFNIVLSDEVKGKVMLNLTDVPWDQALDLILHSYKLAAERHGNVLRVTTLDSLTKEKQAEASALKASESAEPLVVKIFPISYGTPGDIKTVLDDFLSKDANNASVKRGSIQIDERTNSLIVRDTATSMEKIKRILKELDTQTPQVLIEAKFVQVSEQNQREVQGRIFATSRELSSGIMDYANGSNNNYSAVFNGAGAGNVAGELRSSFSTTAPPTGGGAGFGFMPKAKLIPGLSEIGAFLSILESESQAKVIASPRVVAQNKQKAEIAQGQTIQILAPGGTGGTATFQSLSVVLKLLVTPQVTNDGSVNLKVNFMQDSLGDTPAGATFATNTRKIETVVLVDSGATLVIGGIYGVEEINSSAGIPILRDLPIIGNLFGSRNKKITKNELFIFLTPRVLNEKESGIRAG